jgi:oligoendopeptidase F
MSTKYLVLQQTIEDRFKKIQTEINNLCDSHSQTSIKENLILKQHREKLEELRKAQAFISLKNIMKLSLSIELHTLL